MGAWLGKGKGLIFVANENEIDVIKSVYINHPLLNNSHSLNITSSSASLQPSNFSPLRIHTLPPSSCLPSTYLEDAALVAFVEDELLLVQGVQRASGGGGLGLGDALLPRHEVHLHVGSCGKRPYDDAKWRERENEESEGQIGRIFSNMPRRTDHLCYVLR